MSNYILEQIQIAVLQTLWMTFASGGIGLVFGLPLALLMVATSPEGLMPVPILHKIIGSVVNAVRSVPFIILLISMMSITRLIVGTTIGTTAAIIPLGIAAIPYFARIAEISLHEVDHGLIEAIRAMGGSKLDIVREVLIPEALPGLISGFTVTLITLVGASAMAGFVGGGGLGDLAIRYGYQRNIPYVMTIVVIFLIALVWAIQWLGNLCAARFNHRISK